MGRNSYVVGMAQYNDERNRQAQKNNPIDERPYSKELFLMGREQALLDCGRITEEQRIYFQTSYPGDIKNSVNYLRGYKRGIEISNTPFLPPEYLEENKRHR